MNKLENLLPIAELDADELAMVAGGPEPENDPRPPAPLTDRFPQIDNDPPG